MARLHYEVHMTLTLPLLGRFLNRWWWLIALPAIVAAVWTVATYPFNPAPSYGLSVRFSAGDSTPGGAGQDFDATYYSYLSSEYIVANLKDWARTGDFATAVSEELAAQGVVATPAEVAGSIQAADSDRSILVLSFGGPDPARLVTVANAAIRVLETRNAELLAPLGGETARVVALDVPSPGASQPGLRDRLEPLLKIVLGIAVGLGLALLAWAFDPRVHDGHDLRGLRVMGRIPGRHGG